MSPRTRFGRAAVKVALVSVAASGIGGPSRAQAQEQCIPVQVESGENDADALTARVVVSAGPPVTITGDVNGTVAGTTCDIGVYVAPGARATIVRADIHSALAFGVYDDGGDVTIVRSRVHDILGNGQECGGEDETDDGCGGGGGMGGGGDDREYTGGRHGTGVLFVGAGAQGTIAASVIADYGRRGISVSGPGAFAHIVGNQIVAPTTHASWLNGVWIANGARAAIEDNTISGQLSPANIGKSSSAIMIAGGPTHNGMPNFTTDIVISHNTLRDDDTGVLLSNPGLEGTTRVPPSVPTRNHVTGNLIVTTRPVAANDAGILDGGGSGDRITGNRISGYGDRSIVVSPLAIDTIQEGNSIQ